MASPLRVGIDITPILYNRGVSRYTSNIVRSLANHTSIDLHLFGSSFRANKQLRTIANILHSDLRLVRKPTVLAFPPAFMSRMWYGVGRLHIESLMQAPDVFHAWEELIPPSYRTPVVATIHDLAPFKFPETAHPATREKHEAALKRLLEYKSHVIAVSGQTKRDLLELFSFPPDHVHVVPEAVPRESIVDPSTIMSKDELSRFGIHKPYLLWVGVNEPRKNLPRIIKAWERFSKDFDLVLVGSAGLHTITPKQGLRVITNAKMDELASLYVYARALLYVSLYEGFGLPILEAFYYGCPVLAGNNSAMTETAGDAAVFVDAFEVDAIAEGISEVVSKGKLASMQKKMKQRLSEFSWDKSAKATLAVYRKAKKQGK